MEYPNIESEVPSLLKITTQDDEIKELTYETERHDHENFLKSVKVDIKPNSLKKK